VLMLVARVMAKWQGLDFSSTFELPRRVVDQLNTISEQLNALGASGQDAADKRFELTYRDYLLQRFHRVEAGTVRMTTNMDVDLRELFVMPRVLVRPQRRKREGVTSLDPASPMDLAAARMIFGDRDEEVEQADTAKKKKSKGVKALTQVKRILRNVIVGAPGSGKSTLFEWLQLKLASVEVMHVLGGEQAIPLLLRVRQLDPKKLPKGVALIETAIASKDRAALMPRGWIERQMKAGRVLFMLDGLDETEPELCDEYVIPWLAEMCEDYPDCGYLISSRPVGYPPGALLPLNFKECDLLDFGEPEIAEYVRHWCTAIRLAREEPREEARREGAAEGEQIVNDFKRNSYVRNLAQNPLMLSAICLVNYFERGKLPEDRAVLYKLCVEGLLHHWDTRRGIHSEFTLDEKLRTCREVALAMQADDRAEYEASRVQRMFSVTLGDPDRAERLLEHIRYRTGLLIERRAGMFAFAHLTFQEYLAAQAIHEGNRVGIDAKRLAQEHDDGRWKEVIALYCGSASANAARDMINRLIAQPNTGDLSAVLAEAYLSSGPKLVQDKRLYRRVLERIAMTPMNLEGVLERFPDDEVGPIANSLVGKARDLKGFSESGFWLALRPQFINEANLLKRLRGWKAMTPNQVTELNYLLHRRGTSDLISQVASDATIYEAPAIGIYKTQAEIALWALSFPSNSPSILTNIGMVLVKILRVLSISEIGSQLFGFSSLLPRLIPTDETVRLECASLVRQLIKQQEKQNNIELIKNLKSWAYALESESVTEAKQSTKTETETKARAEQTSEKTSKRK
jgi:hypothetical protein